MKKQSIIGLIVFVIIVGASRLIPMSDKAYGIIAFLIILGMYLRIENLDSRIKKLEKHKDLNE